MHCLGFSFCKVDFAVTLYVVLSSMTENAEQQVNEKICKCAHQSQTDRQIGRVRERGKGVVVVRCRLT